MSRSTGKLAAVLILSLMLVNGPLGVSPSSGQQVGLVERTAGPARQPASGSRRASRSAADKSLLRARDASGGQGPGSQPRLRGRPPSAQGGRSRRTPPAGPALRRGLLGMAAAQERPLGQPVARRLHRAGGPSEARDAIHGACRRPARGRGTAIRRIAGTWSFTTEAAARSIALEFPLDLATEPVRWHGRFFSGLCNVIFCTQAANYGPTFELMAEARKRHPRAWSYQRDFWTTGTEFRPPSSFLPIELPNIVRERETRRIAAMEPREGGIVLRVEDVFGHDAIRHPRGPGGRRGLPPGRRGAHRRRRPRRPHQGPRRRRRGRHGHGRPLRGSARRLEDRLRGAAPRTRGPRRRRAVPARADATSASSARTARRATTGAGSTRSGTWSTAGTAAA